MLRKILTMMGTTLLAWLLCFGVSRAAETFHNPMYFNELPGTRYVCFLGEDTETQKSFVSVLECVAKEKGWDIVYFDTESAKKDSLFDAVVKKYHLEVYPTLVHMFNAEFRKSYSYQGNITLAELEEELNEFVEDSGSKWVSVTENNGAVQFEKAFLGVTFLLMSMILLYLIIVKKHSVAESLLLALFATVVMAFRVMISSWGFRFSALTEASTATGVLSMLGTTTSLLVTPGVYVGVLVLAVGRCRKS